MDNSTAVAYINKRGETRSSILAALAIEVTDLDHSTTLTGNPDCRCRPGFTSIQRPNRVDSWQINFQSYAQSVLHSSSWLVRLPTKPPAVSVCVELPGPEAITASDALTLEWHHWTTSSKPWSSHQFGCPYIFPCRRKEDWVSSCSLGQLVWMFTNWILPGNLGINISRLCSSTLCTGKG